MPTSQCSASSDVSRTSTEVGCLRASRSGPPTARGAGYPEPAPDMDQRLRLGQSGHGIGDPTAERSNGLNVTHMHLMKHGIIIQPRDREVLTQLGRFGVLTAEHIRHLVFPTVSVRFVNRRLALLVAHGFASRSHVPDLENGNIVRSRRPLYSLTRKGAELVDDGSSLLSFFRFSPSRWATVRHNLIAVDLLTAIKVASAGADVLPEPVLREELRKGRQVGSQFPTAVLPDGAFTLADPASGESVGYCVEVVRANVKGGNSKIRRKMAQVRRRSTALGSSARSSASDGCGPCFCSRPRRGVPRTLSPWPGHLPHGRNLFLATSYEERPGLAMTFDPDSVLGLRQFIDAAGQRQTLEPIHSSTQPHV
jgi:hypothetical protein